MTRSRISPILLTVLFLLFPTGHADALSCQKDSQCDDGKPCTADYCSGGTCLHQVSCYGADAPASPPEDPIDQVKLTACLAVCKDELCWSASCTNQGECFKMATCVHTSKDPAIVLKPIVLTPCLPLNCDDGNLCTSDSCIAGQCLHKYTCIIFPLPKKCVGDAECDDGKYCNGKEVCQNSACVTSPLAACPALNDPCKENLCNETIKGCAASPKAAGTPCNDGNDCTQSDQCQNGMCSGTAIVNCPAQQPPPQQQCPPSCDDNDACTDDSCDPNTKACVHPYNAKPGCCQSDADCDLKDPCLTSKCQNHSCNVAQNPNQCPSGNPPGNLPGNLPGNPPANPADNPPSNPPGNKNIPSSPTSIGVCSSVPLDDGNPCTEDLCDPATETVTHKLTSDCAIPLEDRQTVPSFNVESNRLQGGGPSCSLRKEVPNP